VKVNANGQVKIRAKISALESNKRVKFMAPRNFKNPDIFVIVGGGPSGVTCAETLRQNGFSGRIVLVCRENVLPYDRVKVSKSMDAEIEKIILRNQKFYEDNHIEVMLGNEAIALNTDLEELTLKNGSTLKYDKIYIATGASPLNCKEIILLFTKNKNILKNVPFSKFSG
jgi:NADPH-dependent 2,4-dienoyl-CoA reductase/sulfur reductase-like enzyme